MRTVAISTGLLLLVIALPASAIDLSLCNDDGITETPSFATRDGNNCLLVDPGNGDSPVPFQYEVFHRTGIAESSINSGESTPPGGWIDLRAASFGGCSTRDAGDYCTWLIYDTHIDNYISPVAKSNDVVTFGWGNPAEYLYVKDSTFANGWKCKGGDGWTGPNGITCAPGEDSTAHSDGIQILGALVNDGWAIFQDSALVNAHIQLMLFQSISSPYPVGTNYLFQGFQFGTLSTPFGESTNWIADCEARRGTNPDDACTANRGSNSIPAGETWFVDVWGNTRIGFNGSNDKIVVVNTGCGTTGCGGSIGFSNGWPHPINAPLASPGPGVCPNGLITQDPSSSGGSVGATFCYTSLENAFADTVTGTSNQGDCPAPYCPHKPPPFVQLSTAGWASSPGTGFLAGVAISPTTDVGTNAYTANVSVTNAAGDTATCRVDCDNNGTYDVTGITANPTGSTAACPVLTCNRPGCLVSTTSTVKVECNDGTCTNGVDCPTATAVATATSDDLTATLTCTCSAACVANGVDNYADCTLVAGTGTLLGTALYSFDCDDDGVYELTNGTGTHRCTDLAAGANAVNAVITDLSDEDTGLDTTTVNITPSTGEPRIDSVKLYSHEVQPICPPYEDPDFVDHRGNDIITCRADETAAICNVADDLLVSSWTGESINLDLHPCQCFNVEAVGNVNTSSVDFVVTRADGSTDGVLCPLFGNAEQSCPSTQSGKPFALGGDDIGGGTVRLRCTHLFTVPGQYQLEVIPKSAAGVPGSSTFVNFEITSQSAGAGAGIYMQGVSLDGVDVD